TKTPPGPAQDAKRAALSPRVRQLVNSINSRDHMDALAPKALLFANAAKDGGIDIQTIRSFVKHLQPRDAAHPDRPASGEAPAVGHTVTSKVWSEGTSWLVRHLQEKPIRTVR